VALLEPPAGFILVVANPDPHSGLFVWATKRSLAALADPDTDTVLDPIGELTVCSARLVVGAPEVVTAWGPGIDTGDGSTVRARMHRGQSRLGLIVVTQSPDGQAEVGLRAGAAAVTFPQASPEWLAVPWPSPAARFGVDGQVVVAVSAAPTSRVAARRVLLRAVAETKTLP
jgi:hypothetical protein